MNHAIGRLDEIITLQFVSGPLTIKETGARQVSAAPLLDDATTFAVPAA